jgi:RNA-directed DNA polymerase
MNLYSHLSKELGHNKAAISKFCLSAPKKYKTYQIPKRTSGSRLIAHPSKQLKHYQRSIINYLEEKLSAHECATAYIKNKGIKYNADLHRNSKYLLKMDFQNFFHSITPKLLLRALESNNIEVDPNEFYLLRNLLFWSPSKSSTGKVVLSIGAPSSPFISNIVMTEFDKEIFEICKEKGITYSRYADDITFSSNIKEVLFQVPAIIRSKLKDIYKGSISVNEKKTVFSSKAHNRHITGITITNENKLSLGRERKRLISSLIHKSKINILPKEDYKYLSGLLSFAKDIEPEFINRMIKKYSSKTISNIHKLSREIHND